MQKITCFDLEYANSKNKSICQIGLICKDFDTGEECYPNQALYVNPEDRFDSICVSIHGITAERVKNEKSFKETWLGIEKYFTNSIIVGHNIASADLDALTKNLRRYNMDIPELYYVCTLDLAKKYIPRYAIQNYRLGTLCEYFSITRESAHDAFDDARVTEMLLEKLISSYNIDILQYVRKYEKAEYLKYEQYISSPMLRKAISEFYGVVRGFSIDSKITHDEAQYILSWRNEYGKYSSYREIVDIVEAIDSILADGKVTVAETFALQKVIKDYLDIVATSPITLATQILNGILEGIVFDGEITFEESQSLRLWLYDNIYLSGHYPFDKVIGILEKVLEDSVITRKESEHLTDTIKSLLNPVETLKSEINTVDGMHVCLSGNFAYGNGQKSDVEKYILAHGGMIDASVKKSTDILLIGARECEAYSNGTYGTKVKKAIEYNQKGCNIQIIKEDDFFSKIN